MTSRPILRTATVLAVTGYLLGTIGLMSATTATADRPVERPSPFVGPVLQLPPPAVGTSAAPLHSPVFTEPLGRKFR